jgi:hypothetical protein
VDDVVTGLNCFGSNCDSIALYCKRAVAVTKTPTKLPTKPPTKLPTKLPTLAPTKPPTKLPTLAPTKQPTLLPTRLPSKPPTLLPTKQPTVLPTNSPSVSLPTRAPVTSLPTGSPTVFVFTLRIGNDGFDFLTLRSAKLKYGLTDGFFNPALHTTPFSFIITGGNQLENFPLYDVENPFKFVGRGVSITIQDADNDMVLLDTIFQVPCGCDSQRLNRLPVNYRMDDGRPVDVVVTQRTGKIHATWREGSLCADRYVVSCILSSAVCVQH